MPRRFRAQFGPRQVVFWHLEMESFITRAGLLAMRHVNGGALQRASATSLPPALQKAIRRRCQNGGGCMIPTRYLRFSEIARRRRRAGSMVGFGREKGLA